MKTILWMDLCNHATAQLTMNIQMLYSLSGKL